MIETMVLWIQCKNIIHTCQQKHPHVVLGCHLEVFSKHVQCPEIDQSQHQTSPLCIHWDSILCYSNQYQMLQTVSSSSAKRSFTTCSTSSAYLLKVITHDIQN